MGHNRGCGIEQIVRNMYFCLFGLFFCQRQLDGQRQAKAHIFLSLHLCIDQPVMSDGKVSFSLIESNIVTIYISEKGQRPFGQVCCWVACYGLWCFFFKRRNLPLCVFLREMLGLFFSSNFGLVHDFRSTHNSVLIPSIGEGAAPVVVVSRILGERHSD